MLLAISELNGKNGRQQRNLKYISDLASISRLFYVEATA